MDKLEKKTIDYAGGKKSLNEVLEAVMFLDAPSIREFFASLDMTLPRKLRIDALRKTLAPRIKEEKKALETVKDADDTNRLRDYRRLERLEWFESFSENGYVEELEKAQDRDVVTRFLKLFWQNILTYLLDVPVDDTVFSNLAATADSKATMSVVTDIAGYNLKLNHIFCDAPGEIDGLSPEMFRSILGRSATINELIKLGKKFHVNVPRYLKKSELRDMIFHDLEARNALDDALRERLMKFTVEELENYAASNGIMAKTYFSKEMVVEYILRNAETTRGKYYVPPQPKVPDPPKEEPPKEEPPKEEPPKEEPPKEEPKAEPIVTETVTEPEETQDDDMPDEAIWVMAQRDLKNAKRACRKLLSRGFVIWGGVLVLAVAAVVLLLVLL